MAKEKENVCRKEVAFMKKRILAVLLAMTMAAACLTACSESSSTADTEKTAGSSSQAQSESAADSSKNSSSQTETTTTKAETTTAETIAFAELTKTTTSKSSQNTTKASDEGIKGKTESWGEYREVFIPSGWTGLGKHENDPHSCFVSKGDVTIYITTLRIDEFIREYSFDRRCSIYEYKTTKYDSGETEWKGHELGDWGFAIEAEIDGKKVCAYSNTLGLENADKDLALILNSIKMR